MWKITGCLFVLELAGQALGQSAALLSGTLKTGSNCLQAGGATVAEANCLEVIVVEGRDFFRLHTLDNPRKELMLHEEGNSFESIDSGSYLLFLKFEDSVNLLTTKTELTNSDAAFTIRKFGDPANCLTATASFGTCMAADAWFFEEVDCKVASCDTCNADALLCDACLTNKVTNDDKTACSDCPANQIVMTNACTDCDSGKTAHSDRVQCVDECTVDNCLYCDDAAGTCTVCDAGYILVENACTNECTVDNCLYCDNAADTCTECDTGYILAENACAGCGEDQYVEENVCKDCASDMTVNSARDGCMDDCTDSNCKFCDDGPDTCGTCNDGYKVEDGQCKDESEDDCDENIAAGVVPLKVLLVVVLPVALLI